MYEAEAATFRQSRTENPELFASRERTDARDYKRNCSEQGRLLYRDCSTPSWDSALENCLRCCFAADHRS